VIAIFATIIAYLAIGVCLTALLVVICNPRGDRETLAATTIAVWPLVFIAIVLLLLGRQSLALAEKLKPTGGRQ
jgi:uncharacterized membrane protein YraQ (UPF0718 family)